MKTGIVVMFFMAATATCCFAQQLSVQISYYYGEVKTTSADGKIPYGPVKHSLVRRIIDRQNKAIIEIVNQDGKDFNTKLSQVGNSNVFSAEDLSSKSFTGKITFAGDDWAWNAWTYDISMSDGTGRIIGDGHLTADAIQTKKYFVAPDENRKVLITEDLRKITSEEYAKLAGTH